MKKNLWMLGMAVAALTSCTQNEVVDVPEGQAIGFDTFVDKTTRANSESEGEINTAGLEKIYVFGDMYPYKSTSSDFDSATDGERIFANIEVTKVGSTWTYSDDNIQYWKTGKSYRFAAYSDGNDGIETDVSYTSNVTADYLKFDKYAAKGKDLVAALHGDKHTNNGILKDPVTFTMSHMLARVVIEFSLDKALENSKVYLSDFAIHNAYNKGNCTYTFSSDNEILNLPTWSHEGIELVTETAAYTDDGGSYELSTAKQYVVFYVIPNSDFGDNIPVLKFQHTSYGKEDDVEEDNSIHDETMKLSLDTKTVTGHSRWLPGYSYKYILSYSAANADETPITFSVSEVETWRAGFGSNTVFTPEKEE